MQWRSHIPTVLDNLIWVILVGVFVFVSSNPPIVLFGLFVVYGLSGWGIMFWRWRRARQLTRMRHEGIDPNPTPPEPSFSATHTFKPPLEGKQSTTAEQDPPKNFP